MPNKIILKKKILNFNKKIVIPGDKSMSIRWVLIASLADGISKAKNLFYNVINLNLVLDQNLNVLLYQLYYKQSFRHLMVDQSDQQFLLYQIL